MYLETILILGKRSNTVRAVNVAEEMRISKASVSRALGRLKDEGCLIVDGAGNIAFTEKGRQIAEKIYERHLVLTEVIMSLGVDRETAAADACKIEHDISDITFQAMKNHIKQYGKQE
ncbi:MAG: metal-dependent transcriptional regulator [Firmicutes bacterium]|nr:metal-dependent transcriptional regulator [Bacillota bacterium]MBQ3286702.1 metal-dependent transcriptional regulator [Bacillota bacterium]MBQ6536774.1 metal-dependent transcriptional regulator [Bacillota bacterium]MBQ6607175.1 metal-dependent transcriptional regulator [Bacillota bacterium]